jgi:hypothetical protein
MLAIERDRGVGNPPFLSVARDRRDSVATMADPDIDLQDPEQLAALLRATGLDEDANADHLADQLDTLVESDNPAFAHVGKAPPGVGATGPTGPTDPTTVDPSVRESEDMDPGAGVGPDDVMPDDPTGLESTQSPIRPGSKPWTDIDRRRSRDKYTIYRLEAKHTRREPIESAFTGKCQAVRVTLPATNVDRGSYIGTFIGKVEASDHLLFSVQAVREFYQQTTGTTPKLERVDLITGARYLGRRFSPVSIFLGYSRADQTELPCFYILEGGSASGQPKVLYLAKDMNALIHQRSGFSFTPLACANNWYKGGLEMKTDMRHPARVYLTSAQERDGRFDYLDLSVRYTVVKDVRRVVAPFELQVEAAMRVLAIAEQIGCELQQGHGGGMQPVLGPIAEALMPWDVKPRGSATTAERQRYCGCPKSGATPIDPTPPPTSPDRSRSTTSTKPAEPEPPARTKPKPAT